MLVFIVLGGILLLVGAYFGLDWWFEGRQAKRSLRAEAYSRQDEAGETGNIDALPPNFSERFRPHG